MRQQEPRTPAGADRVQAERSTAQASCLVSEGAGEQDAVPRRLPPLIALSYFEAAARRRSFALAAKEMHVTPAAVSHQIKSLEDLLGVELFTRHHRKVTLTPAAQEALKSLQYGFSALAEAVEIMKEHGQDKLVITVCAEPHFATKWLVPRLSRFYAKCPTAEVRLQASLRSVDVIRGGPVNLSAFRRAGIDLAIRLGYGEYLDLSSTKLLHGSLLPVYSPSLRLRATPKSLLKAPLLSDETTGRSAERFGWRDWFRAAAVPAVGPLRERRFSNGLLAVEAALAGQGVLLANPELVRHELASGKLIAASEVSLACPFSYFIVMPSAASRPIVGLFRDWLLQESRVQAT